MANKNGMAKNMEHIREEITTWRAGMAGPLQEYHDAAGIGGKAHKALNLVTESVRLLSYTIAHVAVLWVIADGALHVWLWLR